MGWTMLAPQVMDENARPPLEISPPLISKSLAPLPPFLPPAPPLQSGGGAFYGEAWTTIAVNALSAVE